MKVTGAEQNAVYDPVVASITDAAAPLWFLQGGGVSGALARSVDWSKTSVGPPAQWPSSLKSTVAMLLHSRHPMFLWWGEDLVQFYNDAYLPSFGKGKHPAAMGQRGADCWQEIWPIIWPQIEDVMQHGKPSWNEDHLVPIYRNGRREEVYWTYGYSPVFGDTGAVAGTLVVCTETTQRVLAERRLLSIQALGEAMGLASEPASIFEAAVEVFAQYPNDIPFALICEWTPGRGVRSVISVGLDEETRDALAAQMCRHQAARNGNPESHLEGEVIPAPTATLPGGPWEEPATHMYLVPLSDAAAKTSSRFVAFGVSSRIALNGAYLDYLHYLAGRISQRLTARRAEADRERLLREVEAEQERLKNLFAQAPAFMCALEGPDHVFTLANERYYQLVGRRDIIGKTVVEALPEIAGQGFIELLDGVYRTGASFFGSAVLVQIARHPSQPPEERFIDYVYQASRDLDGTITGVLVHGVDQTELRRAADAMKEADRRKDEFLALLAHELRNPLAPIANYARVLERLAADPHAVGKAAKAMNRQVDQMVRLIDDLLDVSRIRTGKIELRRAHLDLAAVVQQAAEAARPFYESRGSHLGITMPDESVCIDADAARLAQVIGNLLHNAAKFTERGGHTELSVEREGVQAVLRVRDDGIGIPASELSRIFIMFTQADTSLERTRGGLGIGLALVRSLVELHGGTVEARSEGIGKGSEFIVRLPVAPSAQPLARVQSGAPAPDPGVSRILIVDDNRDACDSMAELLRMRGHDVRTAYDGLLGVAEAENFHPRIVLMDLGMPKLNGYDACRRIREQPWGKHLNLVALTGWGQIEDRRRTEEAGFDAHLVKPVDPDALDRLLASVDLEDEPGRAATPL